LLARVGELLKLRGGGRSLLELPIANGLLLLRDGIAHLVLLRQTLIRGGGPLAFSAARQARRLVVDVH
jgi:hypothetical protein